jgi:hypothetical protein
MAQSIKRSGYGWGWWSVPAALSAALVCSGCGGAGGPARYDVSGTVTFNGSPVPGGSITFEPDASKGNKGPAGHAKIKDGKYDTSVDGSGTVGGPHVVKITGLGGKTDPDLFPEGEPLFPEWETSVDLPKEKTTQDFAVPATAAAGPGTTAPRGPGGLPEP